ncbi:TPA: hypothetical protein DEB00_00235 [Candidatus Uhrbacteria bacterium]|nr:hypothetical protein [Candidatus Uhrbacteria bacterium]
MKNSTKKSLYLWGGSFLALGLLVWGLARMSGGYNSGTFNAVPLDLTSAAEFEHVKGPMDAGVTIVEYSDFQCPYCKQAVPVVEQILAEYPDTVNLIYRHYPLRQAHAQTQLAAEVSEAAGRQGKFWEMHDVLFANQEKWSGNLGARSIFEAYAEALELDVALFKTDLQDRALAEKVQHDYESGNDAGVRGTPTFFINGVKLKVPSYAGFVEAINTELDRLEEVRESTINAGESGSNPETVGTDAPTAE